MRTRSLCLVSLAGLGALVVGGAQGCSSDAAAPPTDMGIGDGGIDGGAGSGDGSVNTGAHVRTKLGAALPNYLDVPFPSDVYLTGGGAAKHVVDPIPGVDKIVMSDAENITHELAKLDGFSRFAMALFYVDDANDAPAPVDPASLPTQEAACMADASSVFLVDLEATDPAKARVPCRASYRDDATKTRGTLAVGPARGVVLAEGHRYAAVVTSRVKTADGTHLAASPDLLAAKDRPAGAAPASPAEVIEGARARAADLLKGPLGADAIVGIAPYTTHTRAKALYAVRNARDAAPAPIPHWDAAGVAPMAPAKFSALPALPGFTASIDEWLGVATTKLPSGADDPSVSLKVRAHDAFAAVGTFAFEAPNYLQDKGGYGKADHASFARDASGAIVPDAVHPTSRIWATVFVPKSVQPPAGYPVAMVAHGQSGSREYILALANTLAHAGFVTVGIEAVTQGARASEPEYRVDAANNFAGTYKGGDGFGDGNFLKEQNGASDLYGGLKNLGSIRDQFSQSALDETELVKIIRAPLDLAPLQTGIAPPKIDPTKIVYLGDSLGAMIGAETAALEPNVKAYVLNVPGGGLIQEVAAHAPATQSLLTLAAQANFSFPAGDAFNEAHPLIQLMQTAVEPGDPLLYAPDVIKTPRAVGTAVPAARNVLQYEVIWDELTANEGNEALARGLGLSLATPNVGANGGVFDFVHPDANPYRVTFPEASPTDGSIHDVPSPGITGVLVQISPGAHGSEWDDSKGSRRFGLPYGDFRKSEARFKKLPKSFSLPMPYVAVQAATVAYITDAVNGTVPRVAGNPPPVRDFDGDGTPDATDPAPDDPAVK